MAFKTGEGAYRVCLSAEWVWPGVALIITMRRDGKCSQPGRGLLRLSDDHEYYLWTQQWRKGGLSIAAVESLEETFDSDWVRESLAILLHSMFSCLVEEAETKHTVIMNCDFPR